MTRPLDGQLGLFGDPAPAAPGVTPAGVAEPLVDVAGRLPPGFRLGTSSWSFPGWRGHVWAGEYPETVLARAGLAAYAAHPLLRTVGLDRSYYAALSAVQYRAYAEQVPADFRFVVKAPADLTQARLRQPSPVTGRRDNRWFLDPAWCAREVVEPLLEGLGPRLGVLLLQFPPMPPRWFADPQPFADRLAALLCSLPPALPRAVELRNPELLCEAVYEALELSGTGYCYTVHPATLDVAAQHARLPASLATEGPLLVRWNLHPGMRYEQAKSRFRPFTHLQAEDRANRPAIAALCRRALAEGRATYVIANNKAEGCAPETLFRLAAEVAPAR